MRRSGGGYEHGSTSATVTLGTPPTRFTPAHNRFSSFMTSERFYPENPGTATIPNKKSTFSTHYVWKRSKSMSVERSFIQSILDSTTGGILKSQRSYLSRYITVRSCSNRKVGGVGLTICSVFNTQQIMPIIESHVQLQLDPAET